MSIVDNISLSVCIPTYEQNGNGTKMLKLLLDSIAVQKTNFLFEVVVSDNSVDDNIENLCKGYSVRYFRFENKGISVNTNNAILKANSDCIKIMFQDDLLIGENALQKFYDALQNNHWVISNSIIIDGLGNEIKKKKTKYIHKQLNCNTVGMPSVLATKHKVLFCPILTTMMDIEYYYRMYKKYGKPYIINEYIIGQRRWDGSVTESTKSKHRQELALLRKNGYKTSIWHYIYFIRSTIINLLHGKI